MGKSRFVAAAVVLCAMTACMGPYARPVDWENFQWNVAKGAAVGAVVGGIAGSLEGNWAGGALVGAGVGAVGAAVSGYVGYWVDSYRSPDPEWYPGPAAYAYPYGPAPYHYYYAP